MADKKLTTEEILARARNQDASGDGGGAPESAAEETPAEGTAAAAEPVEAAPKPAAMPSSTADILAAARSQGKGGEAQKSAPAAKPGSTADILSAARAGDAGGRAAPKKPAAAKPTSTADILAAARASKAGGGGGEPARPAAAKALPKMSATVTPAEERPSVADMIKAAREGGPAGAGALPPKPKLPSKPPVPKGKNGEETSRRSFFSVAFGWVLVPFAVAWVALGAVATVWGLAAARFMMPNMIVEPPTKFKIGPPSDYPPGTVSTKWKAERGIWIVNTDQYNGKPMIYALASVCTHLGCTPNWLEGEQKFKCPCHGSGFYINGVNFEGPAPRPLERVGLKLAADGSLEVDKSVKFQEELGQWQDPASFVEVS
ncbi:MAG: Rieske 2Fe-2S domain-containing protein [Planctomycetaceae bacterium]|nr:Rieske 2Fe-2S domain-containing protein [Planctomycetaceae bacterium]